MQVCELFIKRSQPIPELGNNGISQISNVYSRLNKIDGHLEDLKTDKEKDKDKQLPLSNLPFKNGKGKTREQKNEEKNISLNVDKLYIVTFLHIQHQAEQL